MINKLKLSVASRQIISLISIFLINRAFLFIVGFLSVRMLPESATNSVIKHFSSNVLLDMWARWDSAFYLDIVKNGYVFKEGVSTSTNYSFFPGYPLAVKLFDSIFHNPVLSGIFVSNMALLVAVIYLYKLVKMDFDDKLSYRAVFYLLIFPTSFFLSAVYPESLFLMLVVATFYYMRTSRWLLVGILGFLCSLTRPTGAFIIIPAIYEYLRQVCFNVKKVKYNITCILLIPMGAVLFLLYLYSITGDPFAFIHRQADWGRVISFPLTSLLSIINDHSTYNIIDFMFSLFAIAGVVLSFIHLRLSYALYSLFSVFIPLSTALLKSIPRYVVVVFPFFILLAIAGKNKKLDIAIISASLMLLSLFTALFTNWYWVA